MNGVDDRPPPAGKPLLRRASRRRYVRAPGSGRRLFHARGWRGDDLDRFAGLMVAQNVGHHLGDAAPGRASSGRDPPYTLGKVEGTSISRG